jgi:hypothetical protein
MGWQINPEALGSFFPAAQFRKSLYHPDVIRWAISAGSTAAAFAQLDKPATDVLRINQVLPPVVAISCSPPSTYGRPKTPGKRAHLRKPPSRRCMPKPPA